MSESQDLVSIIIPYYNHRNYLKQCLDSAIGQDYPEIEVIIVDDGSTDGGAALCDEYAEKYERVRVIHKANAGVSAARNTGLSEARGQWILFCDSDDYYELNTVSSLMKKIDGRPCDFIDFDGCMFFDNNDSDASALRGISFEGPRRGPEVMKEMLQDDDKTFRSVLWLHMYNRKFLDANKIRCNENLFVCEDELFSFYAYTLAENVLCDSNIYYHYRRHSESCTMSFTGTTMRSFLNLVDICREIGKFHYQHRKSLSKFDSDMILDLLVHFYARLTLWFTDVRRKNPEAGKHFDDLMRLARRKGYFTGRSLEHRFRNTGPNGKPTWFFVSFVPENDTVGIKIRLEEIPD